MIPDAVTTAGAAAYPAALVGALPPVAHEAGKAVRQRSERDHRHLKGRLRPLRGCKTLDGAGLIGRAHAFLRNLRGGCYTRDRPLRAVVPSPQSPMRQAWASLTGALVGR